MSASVFFKSFCSTLLMGADEHRTLEDAGSRVTRLLNSTFRAIPSDRENTLWIGASGRRTLLAGDMRLEICHLFPWPLFDHYKQRQNGIRELMNEIRRRLVAGFGLTSISMDGPITIRFDNGCTVQLLVAFDLGSNGSFCCPDAASSDWPTRRLMSEITAFDNCDLACNGNLRDLARMSHLWRNTHGIDLDDEQLDTLAYHFIREWEFRGNSTAYYGWMCSDFFRWMERFAPCSGRLPAPCGRRVVHFDTGYLAHAQRSRKLAMEGNSLFGNGQTDAGAHCFQQIFGFTSMDQLHEDDEAAVALIAARLMNAH